MSHKTIQLSFFIILTLGLLALTFFIFKPYLGVIFLSVILAVVFHPVYLKILLKFGGRKNLSSFATVIVIFFVILVPAILISTSLLREAIDLYNTLALGGADKLILELNTLLNNFSKVFSIQEFSPYLSIDTYARDLLGWVISHFDSVFTVVFGSIFNFILMLLSLYYLLMYGEEIKNSLVVWSPLPDNFDHNIVSALHSSVDAVVRGRLLVSVAQGLFVGLGFFIFGVGNPVLWGFVAGITSLIPILGTAVVTIPAVLFLFISGHFGAGIGLLLWAALAVGLVDNVLSFFFFKGKIPVHPLVILFSILGGVELFGVIGFLVGPICVSAFVAFLKIYPFIMSKSEKLA